MIRDVNRLESLQRRAVRTPFLQLFTAATRGLLAAGFLPSGVTKIMGERFTSLPATDPVGYFFDAFFQARGYYMFIGWAQLAAAVLLLVPGTATIGALIYLPIILNIFLITVTLPFAGTWVVAGMMLLANVYLLCWDWDRLRFLAGTQRHLEPEAPAVVTPRLALATALTAAFGPLALLACVGSRNRAVLATLPVAGLFLGTIVLLEFRKRLRATSPSA